MKKIDKAKFLLTLGDSSQLSKVLNGIFLQGHREPRICMVGRSNVGKSSLINALLGTRLAQVSAEPGKTRKIHFYSWPDLNRILADLPGYGYARASQEDRKAWEKLILAYLKADENLERVLLLWDSRHGPTESDLETLEFFRAAGVRTTPVMTKVDCLKNQAERARRQREVRGVVEQLGLDSQTGSSAAADLIWVSAKEKKGLGHLRKVLGMGEDDDEEE